MKIGEEVNVKIHLTVCCDECHEIAYNEMDCPVCFQYTIIEYGEIYPEDKIIECEDCKSKFEKVSDNWYKECRIKLIQ